MTRRIATAGPVQLGALKTAVTYERVSTKDQAQRGGGDEGFSIPAQREANTRKAESLGATIIADFVDAGESARSANRPKLQLMLEYIREHHVDYVIVHKVDRLARNREDDVEINLAIKAAGATLVSATENIDETPSGMLLHGIMSTIAEFYSQNLATESRKGMLQKAKGGGTPGMAPFGYLNVRQRTEDGREIRTVIIDPERAAIVPELFERYATGEWTVVMLRDDLAERGITSLIRPNKPPKPLATSHIDSILKNRYYVGVVTFEGIEYPGNHEALINEDLYHRVQAVRASRIQSQEKPRVRTHYLKGSIFCGRCGEPYSFAVSRNGQGNLYSYFYCLGRQSLKNGCDQRAVPVEMAEDLIEAHWETVTLTERKCEEIRQLIWDYVQTMLPLFHGKTEEAQRRLAQLDNQSQKVLQAHYADAISVEVLKEEQANIALAKATAQNILERYTADEARIKQQLTYWVGLMHQAFRHYRAGNSAVRRQLNQGVFDKIWLDDDEVVGFDYTPAFRRMLADTLPADLAAEQAREQKRLVRTRDLWLVPDPEPVLTEDDLGIPKDLPRRDRRHTVRAPLSAYLRQERPRGQLSWERKNPGPSQDRGSNHHFLVAGAGFEPATSGL